MLPNQLRRAVLLNVHACHKVHFRELVQTLHSGCRKQFCTNMGDHVQFVPICPAPDSLEEQLWLGGWPNDGTVSQTAEWLREQEFRSLADLAGIGDWSDLPGAELLGEGVVERLCDMTQVRGVCVPVWVIVPASLS